MTDHPQDGQIAQNVRPKIIGGLVIAPDIQACYAAADHIEQLERELAEKDHRIVELSEKLDFERVRLAACGVAAMANTRESMAERITKDNQYYSGSYEEVCKAVDREVAYRERLEKLLAQSDILPPMSPAAFNHLEGRMQ